MFHNSFIWFMSGFCLIAWYGERDIYKMNITIYSRNHKKDLSVQVVSIVFFSPVVGLRSFVRMPQRCFTYGSLLSPAGWLQLQLNQLSSAENTTGRSLTDCRLGATMKSIVFVALAAWTARECAETNSYGKSWWFLGQITKVWLETRPWWIQA